MRNDNKTLSPGTLSDSEPAILGRGERPVRHQVIRFALSLFLFTAFDLRLLTVTAVSCDKSEFDFLISDLFTTMLTLARRVQRES